MLLAVGVLAVVALGAYAVVSPLAPWLLSHRDAPRAADMLVVLGGDAEARTPLAAELFHQGWAPKLLLSGRGDYVWVREGLIDSGVPADRILVETRSASTRENALFSAPILRAQGVRRAIIVTSWEHSARALRTFQRFAPGFDFTVTPTSPAPGWIVVRSRRKAREVVEALIKSVFYCAAYRVCPGGSA